MRWSPRKTSPLIQKSEKASTGWITQSRRCSWETEEQSTLNDLFFKELSARQRIFMGECLSENCRDKIKIKLIPVTKRWNEYPIDRIYTKDLHNFKIAYI